jgi:hypothetical protein
VLDFSLAAFEESSVLVFWLDFALEDPDTAIADVVESLVRELSLDFDAGADEVFPLEECIEPELFALVVDVFDCLLEDSADFELCALVVVDSGFLLDAELVD